jgi:drug/metabolite transporter (DMT)-like permease
VPGWAGFAIALGVSAASALGGVLQKKGIGWQRKGRDRDAGWRREFLVWLSGFLMSSLIPALNLVALYGVSPAVLAAIGGSGIAFAAIFAAPLLGERLPPCGIAASAALLASVAAFAISGRDAGSASWSRPFFVLAWLLPVAAGAAAWLALRPRGGGNPDPETGRLRGYAIAMAAASGSLGGLMAVIMKLIQADVLGDPLRYPLTPIMYAHLTVAIAGPWAMQIAYRHGRAVIVGPISGAVSVAYPAIAAWLIFGERPSLPSVIALAAVICSAAALAVISAPGAKRGMSPEGGKEP